MEEHINTTILDNFESNCENMEIRKSNPQGILRGSENGSLQFMGIQSREQEFIDHTLLGPEYISNTISNSFIIDLMEQQDSPGQNASDCPMSADSEAQLHTILQFVNRQGHIRNQLNINADNANDQLIHTPDKEILDSEFLAMHGNLLNEPNFKIFCSQQSLPTQEALTTDLNVSSLQSLPVVPLTASTWSKKEKFEESLEEIPEFVGPLGTTAKKILPHKKRIPKKLKNMDQVENIYQVISESPPRINRLVITNGSHFECELCGSISESQVKFFSHLKGHYEPCTLEETADTTERMQTISIAATVDPPAIEKSQTPQTDIVADHQVFNEVELNFENFNDVVGLATQHHHVSEIVPERTNMKILNSNVIEKCMEYVGRAQEPSQVCNVHEEVEFSDTEDMLEGIRGVVDKVSVDDTSNDLDMHPTSVSKEPWFANGAFNGITFKNESINNGDFGSVAEQLPMPINDNVEPKLPADSNSFDNEFNEENVNDAESSDSNYATDPDELNVKSGQSRPKGTLKKNASKDSMTEENESSEEFEGLNKRRYICTKCNREFNSCNALKYHHLSHTGERPHQCDICGKSFFAQSALKSHLRVHTGDKPYECDQCHRKFRQWSDLKYHIMSIHSDEKNYQCEFCGKSFSRKYSLVIHRRIHTSERNYKCEFCPKAFRASSYLQNHRKIHTGEKPYTCETCGKKFRVSGDLRRHSRTHERKATAHWSRTDSLPQSTVHPAPIPNTVQASVPDISKNITIKQSRKFDDKVKTDVLLKIEYQKESKDDLLFLDKMASKIDHLFKTEEAFVNAEIENTDLSFVT